MGVVSRGPTRGASAVLLLAAVAALAAGCRRPTPGARDPVGQVRVYQRIADVGAAAYRVLDTVAVPLGRGGMSPRSVVPLQLAARELGANAIVLLDAATEGPRAQPRRRALAIRLANPYADAAALCDTLGPQTNRVRLTACEHAVRVQPADTASWRHLARLRAAAYDSRGAADAWQRVVALDPADADAMFQLGCESGGGRKARAWRRSAAMDPLAMGPRHLLASRLILDEGRLAEGLAFADTVAMGVDDAESHYLRGRALLALGRHEESAAAFVQALARGGEARSWGGLAMARHHQARHADAVGAWRRALALDMNYFNRMTRRSDDIAGEARAWRASQESAPEAPPHVDVAPRPPAPVLAGARPGRCGA